jgi:hypothetical protein
MNSQKPKSWNEEIIDAKITFIVKYLLFAVYSFMFPRRHIDKIKNMDLFRVYYNEAKQSMYCNLLGHNSYN